MGTSTKVLGISTVGQMRKFLANVAYAVAHGEMKVQQAAVAIKACEQINASIYSEAKILAMSLAAGEKAKALGEMSIEGGDTLIGNQAEQPKLQQAA